jgi:microsomal dipeptidase-like Zn-dependent dipeptidase
LLEMRLHEKGWTDEHLAKLFGGNLTRVFLGEKITKE